MYELDREKFGSFIARLRKEKGYTQKELAEKLSISDKAVSKWETGKSLPDISLLVPLADIMEVTVTELLEARRIEGAQITSVPVEDMVKKALTYSEEIPFSVVVLGNFRRFFFLFFRFFFRPSIFPLFTTDF